MLETKTTKKTLRVWLNKCTCENTGHSLDEAKGKKTYLFLRPAINNDLKPDLRWLQENMSRFSNPEDLIKHIEATIIMKRQAYNYQPQAPVLCGECAESIGLEIHEEWSIATWPTSRCSKCGSEWNSFDDEVPGAHCVVDNKTYCIVCYLQHGLKDGLTTKEMAKNLTKAQSEMKDRKSKAELKRKQNDQILEDWLVENSCLDCGETDLAKLVAVPGPKSPPGKVYLWKRDNSSDTFQTKIKTTKIYCKACLSSQK